MLPPFKEKYIETAAGEAAKVKATTTEKLYRDKLKSVLTNKCN